MVQTCGAWHFIIFEGLPFFCHAARRGRLEAHLVDETAALLLLPASDWLPHKGPKDCRVWPGVVLHGSKNANSLFAAS